MIMKFDSLGMSVVSTLFSAFISVNKMCAVASSIDEKEVVILISGSTDFGGHPKGIFGPSIQRELTTNVMRSLPDDRTRYSLVYGHVLNDGTTQFRQLLNMTTDKKEIEKIEIKTLLKPAGNKESTGLANSPTYLFENEIYDPDPKRPKSLILLANLHIIKKEILGVTTDPDRLKLDLLILIAFPWPNEPCSGTDIYDKLVTVMKEKDGPDSIFCKAVGYSNTVNQLLLNVTGGDSSSDAAGEGTEAGDDEDGAEYYDKDDEDEFKYEKGKVWSLDDFGNFGEDQTDEDGTGGSGIMTSTNISLFSAGLILLMVIGITAYRLTNAKIQRSLVETFVSATDHPSIQISPSNALMIRDQLSRSHSIRLSISREPSHRSSGSSNTSRRQSRAHQHRNTSAMGSRKPSTLTLRGLGHMEGDSRASSAMSSYGFGEPEETFSTTLLSPSYPICWGSRRSSHRRASRGAPPIPIDVLMSENKLHSYLTVDHQNPSSSTSSKFQQSINPILISSPPADGLPSKSTGSRRNSYRPPGSVLKVDVPMKRRRSESRNHP